MAQKIFASIGLVILMLPILGSVVLVVSNGLKDPYAFGQGIGQMAIFTLVILGIFYAIAKAKSKSAAWASVVGLLLMSSCFGGIVLSSFAAIERRRADRTLVTSLGKAIEPAIDAAQAQLDSPSLNPQRVRTDTEKTIGALNDAMKNQDPALAECVRITTDQMRKLAESFATYQERSHPLSRAEA